MRICTQVLKLYSWEESFIKAIKQIRNKEVKIIRNSSIWYAAINFIFGCAPTLVSADHMAKIYENFVIYRDTFASPLLPPLLSKYLSGDLLGDLNFYFAAANH